jgi:hypothetical protein
MLTYAQEDWIQQLQLTAQAGCETFLEGLQAASVMLTADIDIMDIGCTACDDKQALEVTFPAPTAIVEDEVPYCVAGGPTPACVSTNHRLSLRENSAFEEAVPVCSKEPHQASLGRAQIDDMWSRPTAQLEDDMWSRPTALNTPEASLVGFGAKAPTQHSFGFYAEPLLPLRPPTSVCESNINTAVRPAPWDRWTNGWSIRNKRRTPQPETDSATQHAGSTTPIDTIPEAELKFGADLTKEPVQQFGETVQINWEEMASTFSNQTVESRLPALRHSVAAVKPSPPRAAFAPAATVPIQEDSQWSQPFSMDSVPSQQQSPESMQTLGPARLEEQQEPPVQRAEPASSASRSKQTRSVLSQSLAVKSPIGLLLQNAAPTLRAQAQAEDSSATPMRRSEAASKPRSEAKSVLSQSTALRSPAAAVLSQAAQSEPKRSRSQSDRKSALSMSTPMSSGAAMALSGLTKPSTKRQSAEHGSDAATRVSEASPTAASAPQAAQKKPESGPAETTEAAPRPSTGNRQGGRPKASATKSVISNLNNSSSSASALLGPMMLKGNPKRRSARPDGTDLRSVV